ncbi:MAG: hypothetical protein NT007_02195 [Candidatus Kapabacteria bacterium]|nr:hypothetical protein [Candidatus Kapabacteria bacterium]
MTIKEIRYTPTQASDIQPFTKPATSKKELKPLSDTNSIHQASPAWQKDILLSAINMLENNIQLNDIHPLDRKSASPIETHQEALIELTFFKAGFNPDETSKAQANIKASDIASLFSSEQMN